MSPAAPAPAALPVPVEPAMVGATPVLTASALLEELRAKPAPRLSRVSGVALSPFSLQACRWCLGELAGFLPKEERDEARSLGSDERRRPFSSAGR